MAAFEVDCRDGALLIASCNLARVVAEARRLSEAYTLEAGHRAFDILHIAAAIELGAGDFFSFDLNQRRLAEAEKLRLN